MPIIAIYNPISGEGTAKAFFESDVLPLLEQNGKKPDRVISTESAEHGGKALVEFLEEVSGEVTIVIGSGDGTLHELINHVSSTELKGVRAGIPTVKLNFVLVPCGTANALYSSVFPPPESPDAAYRLKSVQAFVNASTTIPLALGITTLSSVPSRKKASTTIVSTVVASTCLHASILNASEKLRKDHPGLERFKKAAQDNISKWYEASAKLLPIAALGVVQIYNPGTKQFETHEDLEEEDEDSETGIVDLFGPFAYFLSVFNVDRLEPAFRIAPLMTDLRPAEGHFCCDVVVVRPNRDPSFSVDSPEARQAFVPKITSVLQAAYQNGTHVDLRYNEAGEIVSGGDGPSVIEYLRCGGWEWSPDDLDEDSHLLCSDGTISHIDHSGRAKCVAAMPNIADGGIMIYA